MPTNRFQFSDDFVLNNGSVGINSATPQEELDVVGGVRGDNLKVSGISSFTTYEGFLNSNHNITENTNLEAGKGITGSLSGEVIVGTGLTVTGISSAVSGQGQVDSLKVYTTLNVPVGLTTDRPIAPKPGQLFYNKEFATVEFYTGDAWRQVDNTTQRGRGVFVGGNTGLYISTIEYINIQTTGNTQNFGDATQKSSGKGSGSSSIRGVFAGGYTPAAAPNISNVIDYITIASEGNAIDFGDLTTTRRSLNGCSSSTRALFAGGENPTTNVIDYIQINTLGNSVDFGDLTETQVTFASMSSPTRGFFVGGDNGPQNVISFVTIASTGNAVKFGELTQRRSGSGSCSNSTRGIISGGYGGSAIGRLSSIEYITLASGGNSTVFGELTIKRDNYGTEVASQTRAVFGAGYSTSGNINVMDYVTISTTGNAIDFGDMVSNATSRGRCSDSHGGLGGF